MLIIRFKEFEKILHTSMVMVSSHKMIENFWSAVPRSGWFELGTGESFKRQMLHIFSTIAVIFLWNTAVYLNFKKSEEGIAIAINLAFMFIFYTCALLVMVGIVKHKKSLLKPSLVCFPLICLFSVALFFAGIYFQTHW